RTSESLGAGELGQRRVWQGKRGRQRRSGHHRLAGGLTTFRGDMRAVILSRTYINPAHRGKLRELAGMGCALAVAVPEHWNQPITGTTLTATWGDDSGVRIVP